MSKKPEVPAKPQPEKASSRGREAASDDPIYRRGFAVGVRRSYKPLPDKKKED